MIFVDNVKEYPLEQVGPFVENHPAFPKRTNTEFIEVISENETQFRVWERGAAETLACGTGRVRVGGGGRAERQDRDGASSCICPGGDLDIEWSAADNPCLYDGSRRGRF